MKRFSAVFASVCLLMVFCILPASAAISPRAGDPDAPVWPSDFTGVATSSDGVLVFVSNGEITKVYGIFEWSGSYYYGVGWDLFSGGCVSFIDRDLPADWTYEPGVYCFGSDGRLDTSSLTVKPVPFDLGSVSAIVLAAVDWVGFYSSLIVSEPLLLIVVCIPLLWFGVCIMRRLFLCR